MCRQLIERDMNRSRRLELAESELGVIRVRGRYGLDGRPDLTSVLGQHDVALVTRDARAMLGDLVAANRAEPGEQRRLATVARELADGLRQRHLDDLFG